MARLQRMFRVSLALMMVTLMSVDVSLACRLRNRTSRRCCDPQPSCSASADTATAAPSAPAPPAPPVVIEEPVVEPKLVEESATEAPIEDAAPEEASAEQPAQFVEETPAVPVEEATEFTPVEAAEPIVEVAEPFEEAASPVEEVVEEAAATEEATEDNGLPPGGVDDLFTEEAPAEEEAPVEEAPAEEEAEEETDDLFGDPDDLFGEDAKEEAPAEEDDDSDDLFGEEEDEEAAAEDDSDDLFGEPAEEADEDSDDLFGEPAEEDTPAEEEEEADEDVDDLFGAKSPLRTWTDDTGEYKTVGRLVEVLDGKIRILKENGRLTTVPLSRLSQADMNYAVGGKVQIAMVR